jgi:FkbM family methyltransferase
MRGTERGCMQKAMEERLHVVHTESSLGWGGQEIRILTEAQGMIERGHRVEIWAAPESNILVAAGRRAIPHQALPIARKGLRGLRAMRRAIDSSRPDVVNTHSSTDSWLVALARLTLRDPPPVVRTRHISAPVPTDLATRWLYTRATRHIVTTGKRLRDALIRRNGFREGRITSVPTGVDAGRFQPGDRLEARRALGLEPTVRYIGIVATLRSWKGHLYLIDGFARLAAEDASLRLLVVGDGPMHEAITDRIATLGLAAKVVLAGRQQVVERWFQAMDVFCLPSYANEGVPQAVLQAMLTGLPVVTTPVGSITEAVTDGVTGLLVPPKDVDALVGALRRVLADPTLAARLGAAAREHAEECFSLKRMLTHMEMVFRNTLEAHHRRRKGWRAHGQRLAHSLSRHWAEWRLPRGYERLGTKYGGWWIDRNAIGSRPLLIDCGLGRDISFPAAFLARFGGAVIGIDPNPQSLDYCRARCPSGMEIRDRAFWSRAGETLTFHLPRAPEQLPVGADGISGSLVGSHAYVGGGDTLTVTTTSLEQVLEDAGRAECDILKLDVEGAEYEILANLCDRGLLRRVRQLLVEFHHRATHHKIEETEAMVARIESAGFCLIHVEGRNYSFRREDFG